MATTNAQDLYIEPDITGLYDLQIDTATSDFASVDGFDTAIPVSLFSDSRAASSVVVNAEKRRGWAGDIFYRSVKRELGSTLWTFDQSRLTQIVINQIELAAQEAFAWMLEDQIARNVQISVEQNSQRAIIISIIITAPDNSIRRYQQLWRRTEVR